MDMIEKRFYALEGRVDKEAAGIRATACRLLAGLTQKELGEKIGRKYQAVSNMEKGLAFPPWDLMAYLQHEHRVDSSFIVGGKYDQLPADVQDRLFDKLIEAHDKASLPKYPDPNQSAGTKREV